MSNNATIAAVILGAGLALSAQAPAAAAPPASSFTYQGSLSQNGSPVDGLRDMRFRLYNTEVGGSPIQTVQAFDVEVTDGIFAAEVSFGAAAFASNEQFWVEIEAGPADQSQSYEIIGRQKLTGTPYALNTRGITVDGSNQVGIGTDSPTRPLVVRGDSSWMLGLEGPQNPGLRIAADNSAALATSWAMYQDSTTGDLLFRDTFNAINRLSIDGANGRVGIGNTNPAATLDVAGSGTFSGNVGIGTSDTTDRLTVRGQDGVSYGIRVTGNQNAGIRMESDNTASSWSIYHASSTDNLHFRDATTGANRMTIRGDNGFVGIGIDVATTTLDVNGAVTIRGGADIVEGFDSICETAFEPGTVLVIDPANPGMLMCADGAYDKKVAGVVSGAGGVLPGIKLGQDGVMDGDIPVAMTGRVYVKCSAENGSIEAGDLLTTADIAGHAMKATDDARSNGTVIGKAMGTLASGEGLVLVLVNLQ